MPKKSDVTFHGVASVAQKFRKEGRQVSAQAIRKETGGGMKNVLEQYKVLLERNIAATQVVGPISQVCIETIVAEIGEHITRTTADKDEVIDGLKDLADETQQLYHEAEQKIEEVEKALGDCKKEFVQQVADLQKEIAAQAGIIQTLKERTIELESEKKHLNSELTNSKIEIGKLEEKMRRAEDSSERLQAKIEDYRNIELRAVAAETENRALLDKVSFLEPRKQSGNVEGEEKNPTLVKIAELEEQMKALTQNIGIVIARGTNEKIKNSKGDNAPT